MNKVIQLGVLLHLFLLLKMLLMLLVNGDAYNGSSAGSGSFYSGWVRSDSGANVGFFTTVKLD
nr:MAG: hypothetical protein [Bacteriophage sp.]